MLDLLRTPWRRGVATPLLLGAMALAMAVPAGLTAQKPPLDHDAYDIWRTIQGERVSPDGARALYTLAPRVGDGVLVITTPATGHEHRIDRAGGARFSHDSRHALFTIRPAHDSVRALRLAVTRRDALPVDTLGIMDLATGHVARIAGARSWRLPERSGNVVAFLLDHAPAPDTVPHAPGEPTEPAPGEPGIEPPPGEPGVEPPPGEPGVEPPPGEPGVEPPPGEPGVEPGESEPAGRAADRKKPETGTLVVRDLATGEDWRFGDVVSFALSADGRALAYAASSADGTADGVFLVTTATGATRPLMTGEGEYRRLALSGDGSRVAFLTDRDDYGADQPAFALHVWTGGAEARRVAGPGSPGIPDGWWISADGDVEFSENGRRVFFGTAPLPPAAATGDTLPLDEQVRLDVWHWQDPHIQPMQLLNVEEERKRSYRAVVHLDRRDRIVQLATRDLPDVRVGARGDADVALGETGVPYRVLVGTESPGFSDLWLVDVRDGSRRRVVENRQVGGAALSPQARYAAWYDFADRQWYGIETGRGQPTVLTATIPVPLWNEDDDRPMPPSPHGRAGWTEGDRELLVYDRYDIWAVDPAGRAAPRRITDGAGRERGIRFRYVDLDTSEPAIPRGAPLLLSAFHEASKDAGFFQGDVAGSAPRELVFGPKRYSRPVRADGGGALLYTREDVAEFPDLWLAGPWLESPTRVSHANPQQADYNWTTVELVEWVSTHGVPLQGLLYRPEDFDPSRRYPMLVYFYERSSDGLHQHTPPLPHRSVIRPAFYASRGYIVFVPDIVYQEGYPGKSAMDAVMPGTLMLAAEPWVDEDNIGVQGHSWGGYQIAYMVTQTNLFRAAGAGAPVANMTSAYGGIRWGTGTSRIFQYERTQSRIAGSLWEQRARYIENSPLFFLDRVETPLLIMHNDEDGAVPFEQGIELFMGLRRLGKPAWLINYNDQPHWPITAANIRDWNIRMQQFFDHYLKGAPAPVWMTDGIPATEKGRTLGLETVDQGDLRPAADRHDR